MTHTPLPTRARLLQAILSRRAVEAMQPNHYYSLSDIAHGAALLATDDEALATYLMAVSREAEGLAKEGS